MSAATAAAWSRSWRQVTLITRHPSTKSNRSRSRSASNALAVPCTACPSSSTISRFSAHRQSTMKRRPLTARSALSRGRGRPCASSNATNRSSSSLRVTPRIAASSANNARKTADPRRRGYLASRSGIDKRSVRPCTSTSLRARSSCRFDTMAVRSRIVRGTVVTGIPMTAVRSSSGNWDRCARTPGRVRKCLGLVTSTRWLNRGTTPQSWPAVRWLSTAPGPEANTAAIHRPSVLRRRWPTE